MMPVAASRLTADDETTWPAEFLSLLNDRPVVTPQLPRLRYPPAGMLTPPEIVRIVS